MRAAFLHAPNRKTAFDSARTAFTLTLPAGRQPLRLHQPQNTSTPLTASVPIPSIQNTHQYPK